MLVKNTHEIEAAAVKDGIGVAKKVLIAREDAPHFEMRSFIIQPGGKMPNHINKVEHEQYVLRGQAQVSIGDEIFDVQQGDVLFIPAGIPHWYMNTGTDAFEFICVVPNKPDTVTILE